MNKLLCMAAAAGLCILAAACTKAPETSTPLPSAAPSTAVPSAPEVTPAPVLPDVKPENRLINDEDINLLIEPPTLECISFQCTTKAIEGLEIQVLYALQGTPDFRPAMNLIRIDPYHHAETLPPDQVIFAGSVFGLQEDTAYDVRLAFHADGRLVGARDLTVRTWKEPVAPAPLRTLHAVPGGEGGGTGSAADPFKGLSAALDAAQPGDHFLLHAGVYKGGVSLKKSGSSDAPIVWRGAGDGETVIDGADGGCALPVPDTTHVFFEDLTVRNAKWGIVLHRSSHITLRRLHLSGIRTGLSANYDQARIFIADCVFDGTTDWLVKPGDFEPRGIEIAGRGHVIMHNRISGFRDAVDTRSVDGKGNFLTYAVDICYNEIYNCQDDGIEHDYSFCNTRSFYNRLTNCGQGISFQPIFGGPVYCFRNVLMNLQGEPFKLHSTSTELSQGGVIMHNTVCKAGMPTHCYCGDPIASFTLLNNLYVGTTGNYAAEYICPMSANCRLDGNVYIGQVEGNIFKLNNERYPDLAALAAATGHETHGLFLASRAGIFLNEPPVISDPKAQAFTPTQNDLRIRTDAPIIDRAVVIANINDTFAGAAPDPGAFEAGADLPAYGPGKQPYSNNH